jgi:hypothetical protein
MSGSMPFAWIERPDGVKYRAVIFQGRPRGSVRTGRQRRVGRLFGEVDLRVKFGK